MRQEYRFSPGTPVALTGKVLWCPCSSGEGKKNFKKPAKRKWGGGLLLTLSTINIALSQSTFGVYDCYDIIFHVRFHTPHKTCV